MENKRMNYGTIKVVEMDGIGKDFIVTLCNNKGLFNKYRVHVAINNGISASIIKSNKNKFTNEVINKNTVANLMNFVGAFDHFQKDLKLNDKYLYAFMDKDCLIPACNIQYKKIGGTN